LPFTVVDVESVAGAEDEMIALSNGVRKVPTIVIDCPSEDRQVLVEPYPEELAEALRMLQAARTAD
jgi:glutaredoxin